MPKPLSAKVCELGNGGVVHRKWVAFELAATKSDCRVLAPVIPPG